MPLAMSAQSKKSSGPGILSSVGGFFGNFFAAKMSPPMMSAPKRMEKQMMAEDLLCCEQMDC